MYRNIALYGPYQVFTKRVFLPLVAIYASQVAGLSVAQIGYVGVASALAMVVFETTTGFWADTYGRKNSSRVGAFLAGIGTLMYVLFPSFVGILLASLVVAIGYAFLSGAMAALIHDSLHVLGCEDDFPKVASRAQSLSLVINAGIMALVPMLYPVDPRLPFVVGIVAYMVLFLLASLLTEPPVKHSAQEEERKFVGAVRHIVNRKTWLFFVCAGFMYGATTGPSDLYNLGFVQIGLAPERLGIVFAIGSLIGAVLGYFVHHLKHLSFRQYITVDVLSMVLVYVAFGFVTNKYLVVLLWVQNMALWRFQRIMYQHYVTKIYGNTRYKATLFSIISNISYLHSAWIMFILSGIADKVGLLHGLRYGILFLLVFWPLLLIGVSQFERSARTSS